MRRSAIYASIVAVTTPVWLPLVWLGYAAYSTVKPITKFAFKHPKTTAAGIAFAGALAYAATRDGVRDVVQQHAIQGLRSHYEHRIESLEEILSEKDRKLSDLARLSGATKSSHGYVFYYVKPNDTLSGIAHKVSGDSGKYRLIASDNDIRDPRALPAGKLLRLRKSMCTRYAPDVYERVPDLEHVVLEADASISDVFENWSDVLALNRALGLPYEDEYARGKRLVYYAK